MTALVFGELVADESDEQGKVYTMASEMLQQSSNLIILICSQGVQQA
jgi:hypothetical protein